MTSFQKLRNKLNKVPIPNDMTFEELKTIANHYKCQVSSGGNHQHRIIYNPPEDSPVERRVIVIPDHGKHVPAYLVKELKELIIQIESMEA